MSYVIYSEDFNLYIKELEPFRFTQKLEEALIFEKFWQVASCLTRNLPGKRYVPKELINEEIKK